MGKISIQNSSLFHEEITTKILSFYFNENICSKVAKKKFVGKIDNYCCQLTIIIVIQFTSLFTTG